MIAGILAGICSAVLQSCSYIASAAYLKRHSSATGLLMHAQGVQFFFALPLLLAIMPGEAMTARLLAANALWLVIFTIAQFSMFAAQKTVEPSKIATWLGLKIVVLAVLTTIWPLDGEAVDAWRWTAILITISAAWVLNASGGMKPGWKGAFFLASQIVVASLCDRQQVAIIGIFRDMGAGLFKASLLTLCLGYASFGLFALAYAAREGWRRALPKMRDASPFAVLWFTAMISIYFCYGRLGPVFGNVVQSSRAIIAVAIGYLFIRLTKCRVEENVSGRLWLRRLGAAILMTAGIVMYSLG